MLETLKVWKNIPYRRLQQMLAPLCDWICSNQFEMPSSTTKGTVFEYFASVASSFSPINAIQDWMWKKVQTQNIGKRKGLSYCHLTLKPTAKKMIAYSID